MNTITKTFESRWGYHPVDHAGFIELKKAHKLFLQAMRDCRKNERWIAKDDHNRKGEEPKTPPVFVSIWTYQHVLTEYRNARHPVSTPEEVKPMNLFAGFKGQLEKLQEFYG